MNAHLVILAALASILSFLPTASAARPIEAKDQADLIVIGKVDAIYVRETEGYRNYIVEITVDESRHGSKSKHYPSRTEADIEHQSIAASDPKRGDVFRAFCYQRKAGYGGLAFDSAGHRAVPKEGQRIRAFVKDGRGKDEGVYPEWFDVLPSTQ